LREIAAGKVGIEMLRKVPLWSKSNQVKNSTYQKHRNSVLFFALF
jgi:hypothetical protein